LPGRPQNSASEPPGGGKCRRLLSQAGIPWGECPVGAWGVKTRWMSPKEPRTPSRLALATAPPCPPPRGFFYARTGTPEPFSALGAPKRRSAVKFVPKRARPVFAGPWCSYNAGGPPECSGKAGPRLPKRAVGPPDPPWPSRLFPNLGHATAAPPRVGGIQPTPPGENARSTSRCCVPRKISWPLSLTEHAGRPRVWHPSWLAAPFGATKRFGGNHNGTQCASISRSVPKNDPTIDDGQRPAPRPRCSRPQNNAWPPPCAGEKPRPPTVSN